MNRSTADRVGGHYKFYKVTILIQSSILRLAASACLAGFATTAIAQEKPITLKVSHFLPATQTVWTEGGKKFIDDVSAKTNGRVKFEVYPAGQLGSDFLSIIKSGLADIVMLVPSYQPDKFPLTSVAELPGMFSTACEGVAKLAQIAQDGGVLDEKEFRPNGYKVLFVNTLPQYKLISTSKEIKTLQDVAGLKVRANGVAMDKAVRAIGAVPVKVPAQEMYDAMSRGTVDAGLFAYTGLKPSRLDTLVRYSLDGLQLGGPTNLIAMNLRAWNALSANVKVVMTEVSKTTQEHQCRFQDREEADLREEFKKQGNVKVVQLTREQTGPWEERVRSVTAEWSKELDRSGKPGSAVLKAFQQAGRAK
ncbi:MAG: TRAP transporter substrate-binding protein DctP [Ottowia sp.]|uniref:TRAP transporter substrate-binding protein n=1 Tax=Ottowia sp. TaxID=1898956 RepID=UPI003C71FC12